MSTTFSVLYGFASEVFIFMVWLGLWLGVGSLLERLINALRDRILISQTLSAALLLPFVGDYRSLFFWIVVLAVGCVLYSPHTLKQVGKKLTWIKTSTFFGLCTGIFITAFLILRTYLFISVPEQMWYY